VSNEDHRVLKDARKFAPDLPEGRDVFYETAAVQSALLPPDQRVALIQYVDSELMGDEGNLRQRSQLLALRRIDRGK
jgi:hypothetical protein